MLEQVFKSFNQMASGKACKTTVALLEEGGEIVAEFKGSPALNAALISVA
jgi:ferritin-like metal-binding protein YciE